MPVWKGNSLFRKTETVVNERLSLLRGGMGVVEAAAWLRRMAENADAFLDFIVANVDHDFPNAVAARACVNWQMAEMAKKALGEECP